MSRNPARASSESPPTPSESARPEADPAGALAAERPAPQDRERELRTLVHAFYERVRSDPLLGPVFEVRLDGRWEAHLEKMCAFWSSILYATGRFRGDPIGTHARIAQITPAHFERWLHLFEETAFDTLPAARAADIAARSRRMGAVLERTACSAQPEPEGGDADGRTHASPRRTGHG